MSRCPPPTAASTASQRAPGYLADLGALGLIERVEPHKLTVPRGDRSNAVLEPLLTDQWFVDIKPLAEPAIRAVEAGRDSFRARHLDRRVLRMDAQDQGLVHQPAAVVGTSHSGLVRRRRPLVRRAQRGRSPRRSTASMPSVPLRQDDDVLDTWFSSALWPFSTQGLAGEDAALCRPTIRPRCWSRDSTSFSSGSPA